MQIKSPSLKQEYSIKTTFKFFIALTLLFTAAFVGGCQNKSEQYEIRVSTNPWIGFTPFIYAQEKGWLKDSKFKFIWVVGLAENATLYEKGLSDGFTATQYEYFNFKNREYLKPYFLIDRSNGADTILSNKTIEELKHSDKKIDCYFELSSVNMDIFKAFISQYGFDEKKFKLQNSDQESTAAIKASSNPMLIISYEPYVSSIQNNGFKKISSTRELTDVQVIDAIFLDERAVKNNEEEVKRLKEVFTKATQRLKQNPKEFYETIKGYLENQTYEQFMVSLDGIEWLHEKEHPEAVEFLQKQKIPTDKLIR